MKSGASWRQWKDKKQQNKELFVLFFKSQKVSYISTNEKHINSSICLIYTYALTFCPALPYTQHKTTPHYVRGLFQICIQTTVFLLPFSLPRFIINQSQFFINAYKLYFVLVHNVYIAHENVELACVLSSVFCYLLHFLQNRASISRVIYL